MAYESLSVVYNALMSDGPQEAWLSLLRQHAPWQTPWSEMDVADVGCGTGLVTVELAQLCQSAFGIDASESMLTQAAQRALDAGVRVTWLCQDMRNLRLPQPVNLVLSTCDSLNYLLSCEDWLQSFQAIYQCLQPDGWFCFDVLGPARVTALRAGLWHDVADDNVAIYETEVTDTGRIDYDVHAFARSHTHPDLYERIEEHHQQQYLSSDEIRNLLSSAGFRVTACLADFGAGELDQADRMVFLTRKE